MNRPRPIEVAALLFFLLLSVILVAPSLFSPRITVCGGDYPDTWVHMWAFWRADYAAAGHDASLFTSHTLTYPDALREPIVMFDPLMSLASIPLQKILPHMALVFDVMVLLGLTFTAMSAYALCVHVTGGRAWSLMAGVIAAMNPFIYRQVVAGYTEYAWWGILPLAFCLYLRVLERPSRSRVAAYLLSVLAIFLWSIYCAALFLLLAAASLLYEWWRSRSKDPGRIRRVLVIQSLAVLFLLPLLIFWLVQLKSMGYKGITWGQSFPIEPLKEAFSGPQSMGAKSPDSPEARRAWRAIRGLPGSVDLGTVLSLSQRWTRYHADLVVDGQVTVPFDHMPHPFAESVFGREWLLVAVLVGIALASRGRRKQNLWWLGVAGVFFVLALGPFVAWQGRIHANLPLPYAALYQWLPGFSRLFIPGRFFLGTILCLSILAARGGARLTGSGSQKPDTVTATSLTLVVFLWFMLTGPERLALPVTNASVSPVYEQIGQEPGTFAVLELPVRGDLDRRMYAQAVHKRPIYKGLSATEWPDENNASKLNENLVIQFLERTAAAPPAAGHASPELEALEQHGFRYLILHADGYETPDIFRQKAAALSDLAGDPIYSDTSLSCWRLNPRDS